MAGSGDTMRSPPCAGVTSTCTLATSPSGATLLRFGDKVVEGNRVRVHLQRRHPSRLYPFAAGRNDSRGAEFHASCDKPWQFWVLVTVFEQPYAALTCPNTVPPVGLEPTLGGF